MPFNDDFDLGDLVGYQQRKQQQKSLDELASEQRRLNSLQKCPACRKPVEDYARLCPACRSELTWVFASSENDGVTWKRPALKGEERKVERSLRDSLEASVPRMRKEKNRKAIAKRGMWLSILFLMIFMFAMHFTNIHYTGDSSGTNFAPENFNEVGYIGPRNPYAVHCGFGMVTSIVSLIGFAIMNEIS